MAADIEKENLLKFVSDWYDRAKSSCEKGFTVRLVRRDPHTAELVYEIEEHTAKTSVRVKT